jgi:hypothetical protein
MSFTYLIQYFEIDDFEEIDFFIGCPDILSTQPLYKRGYFDGYNN